MLNITSKFRHSAAVTIVVALALLVFTVTLSSIQVQAAEVDAAPGHGGTISIEPPGPTPACLLAAGWATPTIAVSLYDVNSLTGAASNPRPLTVRSVIGMDWDPATGQLWAINASGGPPVSDALYSIDPVTGTHTVIGPTGTLCLEGDVALDPTTGTLYLAVANRLYTVNTNTGAATLVGTMAMTSGAGNPTTDGLAFDANGYLFALDGRSQTVAPRLYQIDPINASVISMVVTSSVIGSVAGYDIDQATGIHYVIDGDVDGTKELRTLDPVTGQFTVVGPSGIPRGSGALAVCDSGDSACVDPPSDLEGWWPFDETSGSLTDELANGNNGTVYGATWTTGLVDNALDFDGINDYVQVPDHSTLDFGTGDFSIDLWIKTSDTGNVTTVLDKRSSSAGQYYGYLFFLYKGYLALQLADGGWTNYVSGSSVATVSNGFVADGQWHLVALTVDRSDSQGIRWYIDGNEVGTRRNPTGRSGSLDNGTSLYIGRQSNGSYLDATMDEVEIFRRALSASEINDLFGAGSDGKCKPGGT